MRGCGRALQAQRAAAGLTLAGMAERTGYSLDYIRRAERGQQAVTGQMVAAYRAAIAGAPPPVLVPAAVEPVERAPVPAPPVRCSIVRRAPFGVTTVEDLGFIR